jgi:hypothetical protein
VHLGAAVASSSDPDGVHRASRPGSIGGLGANRPVAPEALTTRSVSDLAPTKEMSRLRGASSSAATSASVAPGRARRTPSRARIHRTRIESRDGLACRVGRSDERRVGVGEIAVRLEQPVSRRTATDSATECCGSPVLVATSPVAAPRCAATSARMRRAPGGVTGVFGGCIASSAIRLSERPS